SRARARGPRGRDRARDRGGAELRRLLGIRPDPLPGRLRARRALPARARPPVLGRGVAPPLGERLLRLAGAGLRSPRLLSRLPERRARVRPRPMALARPARARPGARTGAARARER